LVHTLSHAGWVCLAFDPLLDHEASPALDPHIIEGVKAF
jgi:hypothetical protein